MVYLFNIEKICHAHFLGSDHWFQHITGLQKVNLSHNLLERKRKIFNVFLFIPLIATVLNDMNMTYI